MKYRKLILFTNGFPCLEEGEEFLDIELKLLAEKFESILIYVLIEPKICREIPSNVTVKSLARKNKYKVRNIILKYGFSILKIFLHDIRNLSKTKVIFKNIRFYFNVLIGNYILKLSLEDELSETKLKETKLYSYWCGPWFDILMLMEKSLVDSIVFRAHAYDFDVNYRLDKYIPYRNYLIKKNPLISFISSFGYDYYSKVYPSFKNKKVYRLGVIEQKFNEQRESSQLVIVSCSTLLKWKRVHLIIEILKHLSLEIKWIHFGDGPLFNDVLQKTKALGDNISVEFKGHVRHQDIIDYYKSHQVDLVINVSELEGIPVSLMEAISFGIPIMGCDICGISEIVTNDTGFLLESDFNPVVAAKLIEDYFCFSAQKKADLRTSAKNYWHKNFNAKANYKSFINDCLLN